MSADNSAHTGNIWNGSLWWSRRSQTDDSFTVWPRTCNPHAGIFAYKEAITWTSYVFTSWRSVPNRCGLTAGGTLHYMLFPFTRNVDHSLKIEENQVLSLRLEQFSLVGLLRDCYTKYGWSGDFLFRNHL